jgi:hypothetical protein
VLSGANEGAPSLPPQLIELVRDLARFHGRRLILDQITVAALDRGILRPLDPDRTSTFRSRAAVIERNLVAADLDGFEIAGLSPTIDAPPPTMDAPPRLPHAQKSEKTR